MYLTFCFPGFFEASKYCNFYRKIMLNKREDYINNLKTYVKEELSAEFQDLFFKMVAFKPQNRPSIQEVLEHKWFKSYLELNDEQKKNLEAEIVAEFKDRFDKIQKSIIKEIEKSNMESELLITKSSDNEYEYFKPDLKPKIIPKGFDMSFCFKIRGSINPCKFMNRLCDKIISKFGGDNCYIEADKNKLKIIANFEENEENVEENEENENEAIKGNNTTLKIKLYESNGDLLLKLFNVDGSTKNFYDKFVAISKIVENII